MRESKADLLRGYRRLWDKRWLGKVLDREFLGRVWEDEGITAARYLVYYMSTLFFAHCGHLSILYY